MAETEVESILREIRERVISGQRAGDDVAVTRAVGANGAGESIPLQSISPEDNEPMTAENLSLINSHLTTTARAWDRLPPLVSNRSGVVARAELWLKRLLKRSMHWFTWEQVNFNAAVHHVLRELPPVLTAHEQELRRLRARIAELEESQTVKLTEIQSEILTELTEIRTEIRTEIQTEVIGQRAELDAHRDMTKSRIERLVNELRERDADLRDEQRVCFKQLALETSEAAVLEDRGRRKTEALLEELQRRVDQLEKGNR